MKKKILLACLLIAVVLLTSCDADLSGVTDGVMGFFGSIGDWIGTLDFSGFWDVILVLLAIPVILLIAAIVIVVIVAIIAICVIIWLVDLIVQILGFIIILIFGGILSLF